MQATSWTSASDRPARDENRAAQEAADNDSWRQAVSRATNPDAIAAIGQRDIPTVDRLYTGPHPPPSTYPTTRSHSSNTNSRVTSPSPSAERSSGRARAATPTPSTPSSISPGPKTPPLAPPFNSYSTSSTRIAFPRTSNVTSLTPTYSSSTRTAQTARSSAQSGSPPQCAASLQAT